MYSSSYGGFDVVRKDYAVALSLETPSFAEIEINVLAIQLMEF